MKLSEKKHMIHSYAFSKAISVIITSGTKLSEIDDMFNNFNFTESELIKKLKVSVEFISDLIKLINKKSNCQN